MDLGKNEWPTYFKFKIIDDSSYLLLQNRVSKTTGLKSLMGKLIEFNWEIFGVCHMGTVRYQLELT